MNTPAKIFIAYSRKDVDYLNELRSHLNPLERSNRIKVWYDGNIEAGREWDASIKAALYSADIILLLVSSDSISSEYFYGNEVNISLERHRHRQARVIPIVLRPCAWEDTPLSELQALPKDGVAVSNWSSRDNAYADIVKTISRLVKDSTRIEEPPSSSLEASPSPVETAELAKPVPEPGPVWKRPTILVGLFGGLAALVIVAITSLWNKPDTLTDAVPSGPLADSTGIKATPDRFQTFMNNADSLFKINQFDLASDLYDSALVVRNDSYAVAGKMKCQEKLNQLDKKQRYENVMFEAERLYAGRDYPAALVQFEKAAKILPGEPGATTGIDKCNKIISDAAKKVQFENLLLEANRLLEAKKYSEAKSKYEEANRLIPNDRRVKNGIVACNKALVAVTDVQIKPGAILIPQNLQVPSLEATIVTGNDDLRSGSNAYLIVKTASDTKEYKLNNGKAWGSGSRSVKVVFPVPIPSANIRSLGVRFKSVSEPFGGGDVWEMKEIKVSSGSKIFLDEKPGKRFSNTNSNWEHKL